ncbi:MAG: hypothetical protein ACO3K7_03760 [Candidatus Marinamargulisbacteria bacterium]
MRVKPTFLFVFVFCLTSHVMSESLSNLDKQVNASSKRSATTSSSRIYNEKSGYNTSVQVIGSEKKFNRVRFSPNIFVAWQSLYIMAQTYDLISQLKSNGYVQFDGTLSESVRDLSVPLTPNLVINESEIRTHYKRKYSLDWIVNELVSVGVLTNDGFLTDTSSFSDTFNEKNFDVYWPKIRKIELNFSNDTIAESMAMELFRLIKEASLVVIVTQEETTRYQSRKDNFVDGFFDQLGGSILGNLFYKDKIRTVKQKIVYTPNTNVYDLFSTIEFGFVSAPYAKGARGNLTFYGQSYQNNMGIHYAKDKQLSHVGARLVFYNQQKNYIQARKLQARGVLISWDELRESASRLGVSSIQYSWAHLGMSYDLQLSLGLASKFSTSRSDMQLGPAFRFGGTYHFISHLSAYYGVEANFGLNFLDEENRTPWVMSRYFLGVQTGVSSFQLRGGYEWWVMGSNNYVGFDGMTIGLGATF